MRRFLLLEIKHCEGALQHVVCSSIILSEKEDDERVKQQVAHTGGGALKEYKREDGSEEVKMEWESS